MHLLLVWNESKTYQASICTLRDKPKPKRKSESAQSMGTAIHEGGRHGHEEGVQDVEENQWLLTSYADQSTTQGRARCTPHHNSPRASPHPYPHPPCTITSIITFIITIFKSYRPQRSPSRPSSIEQSWRTHPTVSVRPDTLPKFT